MLQPSSIHWIFKNSNAKLLKYNNIQKFKTLLYIKVSEGRSVINFKTTGGQLDINQIVNNITIVNAAEYEDTDFACIFDENMDPTPLNFTYDSNNKSLHLFLENTADLFELRSTRGVQFGNSKTDNSFCKPKYTVSYINHTSSDPQVLTFSVEASTFGMSAFDVYFRLLKDNLVNVEFRSKIDPPEFEIPYIVLNETLYPFTQSLATKDIKDYINIPNVGEDFYFEIHVADNPSEVLYSTKGQTFVHTKYYKAMGATLNIQNRIFGLGERFGEFWRKAGTYIVDILLKLNA